MHVAIWAELLTARLQTLRRIAYSRMFIIISCGRVSRVISTYTVVGHFICIDIEYTSSFSAQRNVLHRSFTGKASAQANDTM